MTARHQGALESLSTEDNVETYISRHVLEREVGRAALELDGFEPIGEAYGPYEYLRTEMKSKIIDQDQAVDAIIEAMERDSVRLENDKRPIASLAFLGPTGVGKSETAKELARQLGFGEGRLVKIDCSNYSHGHEVASLTGSPAGYHGHGKPPLLRKDNIEQPGTVVLFDEIEKGSTELYNLMLQIMGDGELRSHSDSKVVLDFRNTVVILTSNLGAREVAAADQGPAAGFGGAKQVIQQNELDKIATKKFQEFFAPEFINRLNKQIAFHPLSEDGLARVLDVKLESANQEYRERFGAEISLSDRSREYLVRAAVSEPQNGARSLVRALEDNVYSTFGRLVSTAKVEDGTLYGVFHQDELPKEDAIETPLVFLRRKDPSLKRSPAMSISADALDFDPELLSSEPIACDRENNWGIDERSPLNIRLPSCDQPSGISEYIIKDDDKDDYSDSYEYMSQAKENSKQALRFSGRTALLLALVAQDKIDKFRAARRRPV